MSGGGGTTGQEMMRKLANRVLEMVINEMNKEEMKTTIRVKLLNPLLHMIFTEVYPYIYVVGIIIFLILLFTLLTFVFFLMNILQKRSI